MSDSEHEDWVDVKDAEEHQVTAVAVIENASEDRTEELSVVTSHPSPSTNNTTRTLDRRLPSDSLSELGEENEGDRSPNQGLMDEPPEERTPDETDVDDERTISSHDSVDGEGDDDEHDEDFVPEEGPNVEEFPLMIEVLTKPEESEDDLPSPMEPLEASQFRQTTVRTTEAIASPEPLEQVADAASTILEALPTGPFADQAEYLDSSQMEVVTTSSVPQLRTVVPTEHTILVSVARKAEDPQHLGNVKLRRDTCSFNWWQIRLPNVILFLNILMLVLAGLFLRSLWRSDRICDVSGHDAKSMNTSSQSLLEEFHMEPTLVRSWMQETKSCEHRACCFSMFILAGHAQSHELAIRELQRRSEKPRNSGFVKWNTDQLLYALDDPSSFAIKDDCADMPKTRIYFVEHADKLKAKHLEKLQKVGTNRCRTSVKQASKKKKKQSRKRHHDRESLGEDTETDNDFHMIVVLSTSLGESRLLSPEDVVTDRYMDEARIARRDWFALPGLVMNQQHILHGVKGFQPRDVFEKYFLANTLPKEHLASGLVDWFLHRVFSPFQGRMQSSPCTRSDRPAQFVWSSYGSWFESKADTMVVTKAGWKLLKQQLTGVQDAYAWLNRQYQVWTHQEQCRVVLHKRSGQDRAVAAYPVFCKNKA